LLRQIEKKAINETLKVMQPGIFQDFCLRFFPLYNSEYKGMSRHGGTADGKTRKGHPDLIRTLPDGKIIAAECSTEKSYWEKPSSIEKWKPIRDIEDCVADLSIYRIVKIVLCSSNEIPTCRATAESEIVEYCKHKGYAFEIEVWFNAKFEEAIATNSKRYHDLINEFFPDLLTLTSNTAQAAATTLRLYKETGKSLDLVENIVNGNIEEDSDELKAIVLKSGRSPFQREVPVFQGIRRNLDWNLLSGLPIGRMIALIGQPKVGKTSLVIL